MSAPSAPEPGSGREDARGGAAPRDRAALGPASRVALLLGAAGALLLGAWPYLPARIDADPAADAFSAARAFVDIEELARAPHPTGSPESDRVIARIAERLASLGLEVEVQESVVLGDAGLPGRRATALPPGSVEGARVRNVVARRPGVAPRPGRDAILLCAHHDSRPMAPGAGDDISGVATILEVLRALSHGEPLERDIVVLVSDAEELGLWGARAFVSEHPLARSAAVALNLEARGARGASRMFETSAGNERWIERLDAATGAIAADSLSAAIYRAMPRDTDLTVLRRGGIAGYNFAFIGGVAHYHTALDRVETLDPRSVEEQGRHALSLVRELGRGPLPAPTIDDAVFFPLGPELFRLSGAASRALAAGAFAAAAAALVVLIRRGALRPPRALRAAAGWLAVLLIASATAFVAARILEASFSADEMRPTRLEARGGRALLALLLIAAAAIAAGWRALRRTGHAPVELAAGALLLWGAFALALEAYLPGAGYLGSLPLAGGALALLALDGERDPRDGAAAGRGPPLLALAGAAPFLALWPGVLAGIAAAFGAGIAPAIALLAALPLPLLAPFLAALAPAALARRAATLLAAAAALALALCAFTLRHDAEHPRAGSVHYDLDATRGIARWVSADPRPGEWERQFLGDLPDRGVWEAEAFGAPPPGVWMRAAPTIELDPPRVSLEESEDPGSHPADAPGTAAAPSSPRLLGTRVPPGTARLDLVIEGAPLRDVSLRAPDGRFLPVGDLLAHLRLHAPPERVELRLGADPAAPLALRATAMIYGRPEPPGATQRPRAAHEVDAMGERTTITVRFEE